MRSSVLEAMGMQLTVRPIGKRSCASCAKILWHYSTMAFEAGCVNSSLPLAMNDIQDGLARWDPRFAACGRRV